MSHAHRAILAAVRGDLLTPLHAVLDVTQRLLGDEDAVDRGDFQDDVQKMHAAATEMLAMVRDLFTSDETPDQDSAEALKVLQSRLRHDMLNKLNAVINYSEMWIEDAADNFLVGFVPDLEIIHKAGKSCQERIDAILNFRENKEALPPSKEVVIAEVLDSIVKQTATGDDIQGRILVVDDNETNRDVLRRRLENEGHTVLQAADGPSTLEVLARESVDLVLLDIVMPGMNGFEVLSRIKADARLAEIAVIMISALEEVDIVALCISAGAEEYLSKPFNPVLLKARIGGCLARRRLREQMEWARRRADELLHVILPSEVVAELKTTNTVVPRRYDDVAVLFADIVNFTPYCMQNSPEHVVSCLQRLVEKWEDSAVRHGVEKIKTIGDAFMAASGLLRPTPSVVVNCIRCGQEMIEDTQRLGVGWNLRVGIHYGPVVAGVLGKRQFLFDLWGDTVNTAARMESHGVPGAITLSGDAWELVKSQCQGTSRGFIDVKGLGQMEMFCLESMADDIESEHRTAELV